MTKRDGDSVLARREALLPFLRGDEGQEQLYRVLDLSQGPLLVPNRPRLVENQTALKFPEPSAGHRFIAPGKGDSSHRVSEPYRVLGDFFSLVEDRDGIPRSDASPMAVLRVASRYGSMGWCQHGAPLSWSSPLLEEAVHCRLWNPGDSPCKKLSPEPVSLWLDIARDLVAIRNLAADLHQNELGQPEDWARALFLDNRLGSRRLPVEVAKDPARVLASVMDLRLHWAGVRVGFQYGGDSFALVDTSELRKSHLYSALMLQLACFILRWDNTTRCRKCGRRIAQELDPEAGRKKGRRNQYCDQHSEREKQADRKSRQRARERQADRCLLEQLGEGQKPYLRVLIEARRRGLEERDLKRARVRAGVQTVTGKGGLQLWRLPPD